MRLQRSLLAFGLILLYGCHLQAAEPMSTAENVIVVTLDGFRWQEFFEGADSSFMNLARGEGDLG